MIPRQDVVITMTKLGYIKRMTIDTFKSQNRGGKGIKGMQKLDDDYIQELFMTSTHDYIMFFTKYRTCISFEKDMKSRKLPEHQEVQQSLICCS